MRRCLLLAFILCITNGSAFAQNDHSILNPSRDHLSQLSNREIDRIASRIPKGNPFEAGLLDSRVPLKKLIDGRAQIVMPSGQPVDLVTRGITRRGVNSIVWQGHAGNSDRINTLFIEDDQVQGLLVVDDVEYEIFPVNESNHAIIRKGSASPWVARHDRPTLSGGAGLGKQSFALPEITEIDVMVVYTSSAKTAQSTIESDIDSWIGVINTALSAGGLGNSVRVNVVHKMEVTYSSSIAVGTFLTNLAAGNSPFSGVATQRTNQGADLVIAIHNNLTGGDGEALAIGATMTGQGFAVASLSGALGDKTVAHEIGHLAGGVHDLDYFWYDENYPNYDPLNPSETISTWLWPSHAHAITHDSRTEGTLLSAIGDRVSNYSEDGAVFSGGSDPMGSEAYQDVIRIWEDNAATLEGLMAAVIEESGETLYTEIGPATIEREWHENITLSANPLYDPSETQCTECTFAWYEKDTPTGDYYYSYVTTETYYDIMQWTSGHGIAVMVTDGAGGDDEDFVWVDYCPTMCSAKRGPGEATEIEQPVSITVNSAYPNPFSVQTSIAIESPTSSQLSIKAFDLSGKLVDTIADQWIGEGKHLFTWRPSGLSAGAYLIRTQTESGTNTQTVIIN